MRMYWIIFSRNVNYVIWGLAFAHLWTLSVQQGDCDFETGLCGYQQDNLDDFNWTRNHGTTATPNTGPSSDHTTGRGYYMYIETSSPQITGDIARLISPSISNDKRCLEFWYHMYGDSTDELRVFLRPTGSSLSDALTWSKTGDKGDVWRRARVHLDEDRDFNIVFVGVRGTSFRGDIAIDDVSFRTTPCGGDCDFDTGLCGYQQDNTDNFDWTRQQGITATLGTGPSLDHTTGSTAGSYIYIEVSGRQPGDVARLISPILSTDINCLEFWYHMYGNNTEELRVYQSSTDSSQLGTPIWSLAGDQGDVWHNATVGLVAGSNFYVVFEGVRGSSFEGDIAIDDVSVRTTSSGGATVAPTTTVDTTAAATAGKSTTYLVTAEAQSTAPLQVTTPVPSTQRVTTEMAPKTPEASTPAATTTEAAPSERDCDFDKDVCGYQQDNTDDFDWARKYGTSSTTNTGPSSDHTGNGYYIFIEASSPQEQGDVARLMTPTLPTNTRCLEFWYHMYGSNIDQLNIYQRPTGNTQLGTPIWSLAGDQGNVWDQARLDLAADTNFKIVFEGVRGSGIYGDIAVDDVSFRSTPCGDGSCNFDIDATLCGYQQDNTDDFDWTRQQGSTTTDDTGPSSDHTTGSGYYMYVEVSNKPSGAAARLISPSLSSNVKCLEFWYHMYGDHTEELNVYQRFTGSAELGTPIWSLTGDQGDVWQQATVNVVADRNFYIVFEGKRGSSFRGDIAIDDVSYRTTSCVATTVATTTTTTSASTTSPSPTTEMLTTNPLTTTVSTTSPSTTADMVTTTTATTTTPLLTTTPEPSTEGTTTTLEPTATYMTTTTSVTTQETTQDTTTAAATTSEYTSTTQQALTTIEPTTTPVVTTDETTLELTTASETTSILTSTITKTQQTSFPDVKPTTTLTKTTEAWSTHLPTTLTKTTEAWSTDFLTTTDDITTPMKSTSSVATTVTTDEETTIDLTTALSTVTSSPSSTTVPQSTVPKVFTTPTYEHSSTSTDEGTIQAEETTLTPSLPTTKQPQMYTTKSSTGKPDALSTSTRSTSKPGVTKPATEKPTTGKAPPCGKDCTTVPGSKVTGKSEAQGGGSTGIIIGAAAGGAAVVLLVVVAVIFVVKCRRNGKRQKNPEWEVSNPMYDVAMGNMKNGNASGHGGDVEGMDNSLISNNNKNGGKTDDDFYSFNMDTSNV